MRKIGFLGAMNRDVVVPRAADSILPSLGIDAPSLVETPVSDVRAQDAVAQLMSLEGANYLGGSAFNAVRVASLLNTNGALDLCYFGIAGTIAGQVPHCDALRQWRVGCDGVEISDLPPATCLALVEPAGRTLLTALGANIGVAAWLRGKSVALASAIARCDMIHVTSYLDPDAPRLIAEIFKEAHALNPALVVSLDPGMAWIAPGGEGLTMLLRETAILHVNAEEFEALGGERALTQIGQQLGTHWTIVARTHSGVSIYSAAMDACGVSALPPASMPPDFVARDATGAGDTFCGGFIWHFAHHPDQSFAAAQLGFDLARHKVGLNGPLTSDAVQSVLSGT